MTGLRVLLRFGSSYLCLYAGKRSGSDGQGVPAPLGKAAYLESWDSLEDALIEQGRIEVIRKQLWDIQEGFILTYLSSLIN